MKNEKFADGAALSLPVNSGTVSGSPVIVGMLVGTAITDRRSDGTASVKVGRGVYTQSVTASGAITVGQPIYITVATYALSDAAGVGKELYGHSLTATTGTGTKSLDVRVAHYAVGADTPA